MKHFHTLTVVLLPLFASIVVQRSAIALEHADPAELGLSASGLARITDSLRSEVANGRIAGAVGLIARHGRIGYLEAVGNMDREAAKSMEPDTIFRIASMTKAVTTVAVMDLIEDGDLRVTDPISKYLPELENLEVLAGAESDAVSRRVPASRAITIHDLLTHTSGITYGWSGPPGLDRLYHDAKVADTFLPLDETMADHVRRLARLPLKFQPGTRWDYGLSLDVLGRLVEVISGLTLEQFFRERIFRPLGMRDTHFYVPDAKLDRLAALYTPADNGALRRVGDGPVTAGAMTFSANYCHAGSRAFFQGGGGLVSTATDYARFLQMLLEGGALDGVRVLDRKTVARMTANQTGDLEIPAWGHGDAFGYGFAVLTERGVAADVASVGTFSWGGIFNTYYWVDPQERLVGILMTQIYPFDHLKTRGEFKRLAHEAIDDSGFECVFWYEPSEEHANPHFNARQLRVNAPEVSTHETFAARSEPRSSGMARILVDEDLRAVRRALLSCEIWGGHPGTARKRVSINGRSLYAIPEVGCEAQHCTHQYPTFALRITDLVNGYNSLQFACDTGSTFWGHYIVDNVCIRVGLPRTHERLEKAGLSGFAASVRATRTGDETIELRLAGPAKNLARVESVSFDGRYFGYDENGNGFAHDWHGMTKERLPYANIGTARGGESELSAAWDTSFLPAQKRVAVRAVVTIRDEPDFRWITPVLGGLEIPDRESIHVSLHHVTELPAPFWSRAGRKKRATIRLDVEPSSIEGAVLHVVAWTGGAGDVKDYFTLNGRHLPIAEGNSHELVASRVDVDPGILRKGTNVLELHSDTAHHGIEIMLPGPALAVRARKGNGTNDRTK